MGHLKIGMTIRVTGYFFSRYFDKYILRMLIYVLRITYANFHVIGSAKVPIYTFID